MKPFVTTMALIFGGAIVAQASDLAEWIKETTLQDSALETHDGQTQARYRYVWTGLTAEHTYGDLADGLLALCNNRVLPDLGEDGAELWQIVVSVADRETILGDMDPETIQIFDSFEIVDGSCSWGEL